MTGNWDMTVALAFASEELLFAAQALSSELIDSKHGFIVAHRHLHGLLRHERYLPSDIRDRLQTLGALYLESERFSSTDPKGTQKVTVATMAVLSDVRDWLLHPH